MVPRASRAHANDRLAKVLCPAWLTSHGLLACMVMTDFVRAPTPRHARVLINFGSRPKDRDRHRPKHLAPPSASPLRRRLGRGGWVWGRRRRQPREEFAKTSLILASSSTRTGGRSPAFRSQQTNRGSWRWVRLTSSTSPFRVAAPLRSAHTRGWDPTLPETCWSGGHCGLSGPAGDTQW